MADEDEEKKDAEGGEGGEAAEGAEGEGGEAKKGGKKKLILFIAAPLLLLIIVGAGLYFTGMLDSLLGKTEECVEEKDDHGEVIKACPTEEEAAKEGGHAKKKGGGGHGEEGAGGPAFLEIPTITVNLYADDGSPRYLRLTVQLEVESEEDKLAVEAVIPRVIDQFQTYLRELRVRDLRGSAGIYRLQMELLWRVNQAAAPAEVKKVLFQEILIQ